MDNLIKELKERFLRHDYRHPDLKWEQVEKRLRLNPSKGGILTFMEEPDVIYYDNQSDEVWFVDCCVESPVSRRSMCYDELARTTRKKNAPAFSVEMWCTEKGVELLDEQLYHYLQTVEKVDQKTSSWLKTPESIRVKGGAIFGDRRYDTVFIYHNGADSYYSSRGFRVCLKV